MVVPETQVLSGREVGVALHAETARLSRAGVTEAASKMGWLLSELLGCAHLEISLYARERLSAEQEETLRRDVDRLMRHEPVQYVVGTTNFMGCPIVVDARVLIPRPETEMLVDHALRGLGEARFASWCGADVGTGSGCVAIALARACSKARLVGLDVSRDALDVAEINVRRNQVTSQVELRQEELLDGVAAGSLDFVVSNPPYVAASEYDTLPAELQYEPRVALDGGEDGLSVIRRLVPQAMAALRDGGLFIFEIGEQQGAEACRILRDAGFSGIRLHTDMAEKDRIVEATRP